LIKEKFAKEQLCKVYICAILSKEFQDGISINYILHLRSQDTSRSLYLCNFKKDARTRVEFVANVQRAVMKSQQKLHG